MKEYSLSVQCSVSEKADSVDHLKSFSIYVSDLAAA